MRSPEHKTRDTPHSSLQNDTELTIKDVERLLEQNEANENTIERTNKREALLTLLHEIQSDD